MSLSVKRWFIMAAGLLAMIAMGLMYSGSVFMEPLGEALERTDTWSSEWGLIYGMGAAFLPVGMLLAGKLADRGYVRLTTTIGGLLLGGGICLAGFGSSVGWVALTLGFMASVGGGCTYGTVISTIIRWFPDRRGLASGMAVMAVGLGPSVLAELITYILSQGTHVLHMLKIVGAICLAAMCIAAFFLRVPPEGWTPEGWTPPEPASDKPAAAATVNYHWTGMIKTPLFWLLFFTNVCGLFSGLLVNGLAVPIAKELAGYDAAGATLAVTLFAFGSAGGRLLWGTLSDYFGRIFMIGVAFVLTASAMLVLYTNVTTPGVYMPCVVVIALCYGGVFGTFPSLSADSFGVKNSAVNLAVLYFSVSISALSAPQIAGHYRDGGHDSYPYAFLFAGTVAVVGLVLSIIVARLIKARRTNAQ